METTTQKPASTTMGLTKYIYMIFIIGWLAVAWLLTKVIETTWTSLNLTFAAVPPLIEGVAVATGGICAALLAIYLWRHPKVSHLSTEIVMELSKVTWSTRKELSASTVVVIIISIIASVIIGLFDFFWAWLTDLVYL